MGRSIPAIILAAGASERLGQPKALLEVEGGNLVGMLCERLLAAGCDPVIIVTRAELSVDCMLACPGYRVAVNSEPEAGRTGTLKVGLMALAEEAGRTPRAALIAPVDRPGWTIETARRLLELGGCVCPVKDGRGGHPLLLDESTITAILAAQDDVSLRDLASPGRIEVKDPHLHLNIDSEADLAALAEWAADPERSS